MSWFEFLYPLVFWAVLLQVIPRLSMVKKVGFTDRQIQLLFSIKVLVGIVFILLYTYYYGDRKTTDAYRFFDDGRLIFESLKNDLNTYSRLVFGIGYESELVNEVTNSLDNWYKEHHHGVFNDNMTIIRFNALVHLFSFNNYHIHSLVMNSLSFVGMAALSNSFKSFGGRVKAIFLSFYLFPGILFWTSGVLKESLLVFVIGYVIYYLFRLSNGPITAKLSLSLIVFLVLGVMIKSYVLVAVLVGWSFYMVTKLVRIRKVWLVVIAYLLVGFIGAYLLNHLFDLKIPENIYQKQHDFLNEIVISKPGSAFEVFVLEPTWISLFKNVPVAFFNTAFRPFIWEAHSGLSLISGLENVLFITVIALCFFLKRTMKRKELAFVLGCLIMIAFIFTIVGLVTPVFGALVRYKIPGLMIAMGCMVTLMDWENSPLLKKLKQYV